MNQATSDNHSIADNFWFVFFAYFLAVATWSILASHDFLSSSWETVERTRKVGRWHLAFVVPPMAYMCVYMHYQSKAADYKEFNAALVALGFAVLHMARTIMGLWQLHVFKQWAVRSIISMESLGYRTGMMSGGKEIAKSMQQRESIEKRRQRVNEEADKLLVNETIVDNKLFEGEVRCKLRLINERQQEDISSAGNWLTRVLLICMHGIASALSILGVIWQLLFSKSSAFSTPASVPYLVPREPRELYLRWSIVLISRAFPEWVSDMAKARFETVAKQVSEYGARRDRFAAEIMYSAAFHTGRPCAGTIDMKKCEEGTYNNQERTGEVPRPLVHRLLPYEHWHKFPKLRSGKFCKYEFLAYACRSGEGLPFSAPHTIPETQNGNPVSYSRYRSKLDRARDSLPADEAEKVADFDIEALEWLTVCLCIADWNASRIMNAGENVKEPNAMSGSNVPDRVSEKSFNDTSSSQPGTRTDIALQNLANQLGFDLDSSSFLRMFSNPFLRGTESCLLWGNRNILEASLYVDNWLAICGGEQVAYMANEIPGMEIGALFCDSEGEGTRKECVRLEQLRFMFQISDLDPEHSYCDQSLTFLGVIMENLRSMLAKWVEASSQTQSCAWTPEIKIRSRNSTEIEEERGLQFRASADFEGLLRGIAREELFSLRFVKMRMLSEVQSMLQCLLLEQGCCPDQTAALILCVLSFPSLCFEVRKKEAFQSDLQSTGGTRRQNCCIQITGGENDDFDIVDYIVTVRAALSPQAVHVDISFSTTSNKSGVVVTVHLCGEKLEDESLFKWGLWRDAFAGSLEGIRLGREQHGFQSAPVFRSNQGIEVGTCTIDTSNSGTGTTMKTWGGWLPWHPAICKYELMTDGFIKQLKTVGGTENLVEVQREDYWYNIIVSQHEYEAAHYDISSPSALQHASRVAHDFLQRASESTIFPLDGWNSSIAEDICSRADSILKGGKKRDINAALVLYEVAASELGKASALCKAIDILLAEENSIDGEERSIALLERFYLTDCGKPVYTGGSAPLRSRFQDEELVSLLQSQYQALVGREKSCTKTVTSYGQFCVLLFTHGEENALDDGIRTISKAVVQYLQPQSSLPGWELRRCFLRLIGKERKEHFYLAAACHKSFIQLFDSFREKDQSTAPETTGTINTEVPIGQYVSNMNDLALLFDNGAERVPRDAPRAVELYTRAIEEGADVSAMYNLAVLLEKGAEGVPCDAPRAAELYTRAIEEGDSVSAMNNLAFLLKNGAAGVPRDGPRAVHLYARAIEEGANVSSMYNLALLLQYGDEGVPRDAPRAVELYIRAIEEGAHVPAMNNLAVLLENGAEGVPRDASRAVELYTRAIEEGANVSSMYNLALLVQYGDEGVPRDAPRAVELYTRAIEQGADVSAMYDLAVLLENGAEGVPRDALRAVELYTRAIEESTLVPAMNNLAFLLNNGAEGVPRDASRAVELYTRAIEEGQCVPARTNLADLLKNGAEGVPCDASKAVDLYTLAIEECSDLLAMNNLAVLVQNGAEGVPCDALQAVELYTRAIEEGAHVPAMNNLAVLLENGAEGVPRDATRAVELYTRAIEEGANVSSMYNLALLLQYGDEGVPRDAPRAVELYTRAIEEGAHVSAMNNLVVLLENGADGVPRNEIRAAELFARTTARGD